MKTNGRTDESSRRSNAARGTISLHRVWSLALTFVFVFAVLIPGVLQPTSAQAIDSAVISPVVATAQIADTSAATVTQAGIVVPMSSGTGTSSDGRITITKTPSRDTVPAGGAPVTYTYRVTNNTNEELTYMGIEDDTCGSIQLVSGMRRGLFDWFLRPGETAVWQFTTTVTETVTNTVSVRFDNWWHTIKSYASAQATVTRVTNTPTTYTCDSLWYADSLYGSAAATAGTLSLDGTTDPAFTISQQTGTTAFQESAALAVDPANPNLIYYVPRLNSSASTSQYGGLWVYEATTDSSRQLLLNGTTSGTRFPDVVRLGAAPDGTVWAITTNGSLWSYNPAKNTSRNWGVITTSDGRNLSYVDSGDLAFDGNGTLYFIVSQSATSGTNTAYLYTISKTEQTDGSPYAQLVGTMGTTAPLFNGLAFTSDGRLWASRGVYNSGVSYLYEVNIANGAATQVSTISGAYSSDLGSCALPRPELRVLKTAEVVNPNPGQSPNLVLPGQTVRYTVTVENLGSLDATNVTFQDIPTTGTVTAVTINGTPVSTTYFNTARLISSAGATTAGVIASDGVATITIDVLVPSSTTQTQVCNQANVTLTGQNAITSDNPFQPGGNDPTCLQVSRPEFTIDKTADTQALTENPQLVTYYYDVTNTGGETLRNVTVVDDRCSPVTPTLMPSTNVNVGDMNQDGLLQIEEVWQYSCQAWLTEPTVNTATTTGIGIDSGKTVTDQDTWEVTAPVPAISIIKQGSTEALSAIPTLVDYTYTVTAASSQEPIENVVVTDDRCAPPLANGDPGTPGVTPLTYVSGDTNGDGLLDISESWTYTCSSWLSEATYNVATVNGDGYVSGLPVTANDDWNVTLSDLTIDKTSDAQGTILNPGDTVTYTVTVTNNGTTNQSNVTLNDVLPQGVTYAAGSSTRTYPRDITTTVTNTGTYTTTLGALDFGRPNTTGTQTMTVSSLPANSTLVSSRVVINGSTYLGSNKADVSVVARTPNGGLWFAVDDGVYDADNNEFGVSSSGTWNTVTKSTTVSGPANGTYTLTWSDPNDYWGSYWDQKVTSVGVTLTYQYPTSSTSRAYVTEPARSPEAMVTAADGVTLRPGESMTVTSKRPLTAMPRST